VFNLSIGSRSTNLWLVMVSINFVQDVFFLKPLKLYINFVVINGTVSREVRELCERLSKRSKLIMMRTHGLVRDADALVQHFNPAVRTARMYPALPISRFLMSLNDHDIPYKPRHSVWVLPYLYFIAGLLSLTLLPEALQESSLEILSGVILDFGAIGFYVLGRKSFIAAVVITLGVVGIILVREWYKYGLPCKNTSNKVGVEDWPFKEGMFHTLDEHSEDGDMAAELKHKQKTFSEEPITMNKSKLTMKKLDEINAKIFEDESDEEEIIVSDLINFDGVGELLSQPMGASKVFDANAMGSVASLQSFKRRPSSPGASFMLGQLDSGGSMMDDNSSFYTEMQSNMGNQSRMISSRGNTASRNSTRSLGATFIPKTGVYIPGMTPIAGPPIASFKSPHASMYESSIASSMNVNSRLDSNGRKYLAERRDSFASEDLNDAMKLAT